MDQVPEAQSQFAIRKAEAADLQGILSCLEEAFAAYRDRYTPAAFADTVPDAEALQLRLSAMMVWVAASRAGQVVGTVACRVNGPEGHVRGMAVLPSWQGAGVATRLLESVESELRDRGCSRISLDTTAPLERAILFYETHGFRRSGKIAGFFGMPLFEFVKTIRPLE